MLIRIRKSWEIPDREATPKRLFLDRRAALAGAGALVGALAAPAVSRAAEDPSASLYPARRNEAFKLDRAVTAERINADYNNFYEFGMSKHIADSAAALKTRPWSVKIDGLVNAPQEIAIDDLVRRMQRAALPSPLR